MLMENKALLKIEESTKKKCSELEDSEFWTSTFDDIIEEFTKKDDNCELDLEKVPLNHPQLDTIVSICEKKLGWTQEYALEKSIPMITRWQVNHPDVKIVKPIQIIKKRVVHGTPSYVW